MPDRVEEKIDKIHNMLYNMDKNIAVECEKNKNHRESKILHLGGYLLTTGVVIIYLLKTFL